MKTLLTVAFIAVAVIAPEVLPGLLGLAAGSLGALAVTAAVEVGLSLAAGVLIGPTTPKGLGASVNNQVQRLFVTMDTTAPRKIVFGDTAGATDLRYQAYTGTNQRFYEQIIAVASHAVNSIYEIWFDNEIAWSASGGVQGRYAGFLTVDVRNVGTSANGIAIDTVWTSSCTLTGCGYVHLKFDLLGTATDGSNNSPFASGVTNRVTIRTQGALVYDPRLDSTVAGGSGSQRAATQSTWAWNANGSNNTALQLLWYLLGWQINGKLACGMGLPAARIDLASFAVAANANDAAITLNGGGTEPRYRSAGVVTEGDDRPSVIEGLCAAMNAVLRDAGGKLSLTVLSNDLATPIASLTEADILGGEQWEQTPSLSSCFNVCRGRRVDPSNNSLYQLVDVPEASLTSNDGINRIDTMDMPFVSSNGQAQRLLKQRLERKQYQGKYTLTGWSAWWQTSLGNVVQLSHQGLGWSNKLFRVAGQSIARTGETKMTLIEENAAIYAWGNNESAPVTPAAPTVYDPTNSPVLSKANFATKTAVVINPINDVIISADSTGAIKSGELPRAIGITASLGSGTTNVTTAGTWSMTTTSGITATIGASTGILNITAMTGSEVWVPISFTYNGITRAGTVHIVVVSDPPTAPSGGGGGGGGSGTSGSTTTLGATTGTAYDTTNAVSAIITANAGSAGQVACVAPPNFKRTPATADGTTGIIGKWQWRLSPSGTWADIATEQGDNLDAQTVLADPRNYGGNASINMTKTGLTNGTAYDFRFLWRRVDVGGTAENVYYVNGTLSATGS